MKFGHGWRLSGLGVPRSYPLPPCALSTMPKPSVTAEYTIPSSHTGPSFNRVQYFCQKRQKNIVVIRKDRRGYKRLVHAQEIGGDRMVAGHLVDRNLSFGATSNRPDPESGAHVYNSGQSRDAGLNVRWESEERETICFQRQTQLELSHHGTLWGIDEHWDASY